MPGGLEPSITARLQALVPDALGPALDVVSVLGGTLGWVLFTGLAFWWSGSRLGTRVGLVVASSAILNVWLKWGLAHPRPYFVSDHLEPLQAAVGFGMPSGHAQGSASLWGALALWGRRRWLWIAALLATLLAGGVRVYYGVHDVPQVLSGWLIGAAWVGLAGWIEPRIVRSWPRASAALRWTLVLLPPLLLLGGGLLLRELLHSEWTTPADWLERHRSAVLRLTPLGVAADLVVFDTSALARWAGALLGASLTGAWYAASGARRIEVGTWLERLVHTTVGLAAGFSVLVGLELAVRRFGAPAELVRFGLLFLVVGVVAPRLAAAAIERRRRRTAV